jgi:phosphate ABC transporter phosphate-binding protein
VKRLCRVSLVIGGAAAVLMSSVLPPVLPAAADEPIYGEGSTWSFPAIQQWEADMANQGETINYNSVGSTAGRVAFYNAQADFAVSEIPFQPSYCTPTAPPVCDNEQQLVQNSGRTYLYMPIVAGGTSIGYNLQINGEPFRNLRLNSAALAGIFTGVITYWDNPAIEALNPGVTFPHIPVHPVGRSDGSGTSYQFSAYLATMQPAITHAYCARLGLVPNCLPTSQWPNAPGMTLQNGSDGVANYVTATYNNGAIGYAEYAYWTERNAPVVSVENAAGQFQQPTAVNVAVALTRAVIDGTPGPLYHTQILSGVYVNPDPRTYPISSYSYMIVPTNDVAPMDTGKGATLSKFILYFLCQGQQEAQPLGYSPLPPNLVQLGYDVNNAIPGGTKVGLATPADCNNPTFHGFLQQNGIGTEPGVPGVVVIGIGTDGTQGKSGAGTASRSATSGNAGAGKSKTGAGTGSGANNTGDGSNNAGRGRQSTGPQAAAKNINYKDPFSPSVGWWSVFVLILLALGFVIAPFLGTRGRPSSG